MRIAQVVRGMIEGNNLVGRDSEVDYNSDGSFSTDADGIRPKDFALNTTSGLS